MCLWEIYIFPGSFYIFPSAEQADPSWEYIIRSQTHECGNWDWGPYIPFLGIFVSNFRHFVFAVYLLLRNLSFSLSLSVFFSLCCRQKSILKNLARSLIYLMFLSLDRKGSGGGGDTHANVSGQSSSLMNIYSRPISVGKTFHLVFESMYEEVLWSHTAALVQSSTVLCTHCKKRLAVFPSQVPLARNNLIIPGQGEFGKWHPGWRRENQ